MHYCKPNPSYYLEVLERMGCAPDEALMVGNDVEEDLAAAKVGLKTFLVVNEFTVQRGAEREMQPDFEGTLSDLAELLQSGAL
jgi:FMN phosphatase YigB (HAD superfamily)